MNSNLSEPLLREAWRLKCAECGEPIGLTEELVSLSTRESYAALHRRCHDVLVLILEVNPRG